MVGLLCWTMTNPSSYGGLELHRQSGQMGLTRVNSLGDMGQSWNPLIVDARVCGGRRGKLTGPKKTIKGQHEC